MPTSDDAPSVPQTCLCGYALKNSEFPCYLVLPERYLDHSHHFLDTLTENVLALEESSFFQPLGSNTSTMLFPLNRISASDKMP